MKDKNKVKESLSLDTDGTTNLTTVKVEQSARENLCLMTPILKINRNKLPKLKKEYRSMRKKSSKSHMNAPINVLDIICEHPRKNQHRFKNSSKIKLRLTRSKKRNNELRNSKKRRSKQLSSEQLILGAKIWQLNLRNTIQIFPGLVFTTQLITLALFLS